MAIDFKDGSGGTALSVSRGYDQQYRMTTNVAGSVYNTEYPYYLDSNVKDILDHTSVAADRYFNYDDLGRLTGIGPVEDSPTTALTYDKVGNRRTRTKGGTTETYKYIADSNLLEYVEGDTLRYFSYDAAGNPTTITELEPTWGEDADLTGKTPIELARYTYNGFGQRIKKVAGGSTVIYHYDLAGNLIAETTDTGAMIAEYIYLGTERLVVIASSGGTEQVYYYINDHLGTPQAIVDQTGSAVWRANYDSFGTADISIALFDNNFRFAGQYYDQETGLHYNWHRYYDPSVGRYLTPDPIGLAGGINLYAYVQNDPINFVDPWGLRIQIMGSPAHQEYTLSQLRKFVRGNLSIDDSGMLSRSPCEGDEGTESLVDELINSDRLYKIYDNLYSDGTGRSQSVPTAYGGDIYFDPNVDANYFTGPFSQAPITPAAELAHELLGRGIQFERGEPHGRYGSRARDISNRRAMERANPAFSRMGMKPRFRYK